MQVAIVDEGGNAGVNAINIVPSGSNTILGGTGVSLNGDYNSIHIYCDGVSKWFAY
jgi:hypothetical protein